MEDHSRYTYLVFLRKRGDLAGVVQTTLKKFPHHQKKHTVNMELSTSTIQLHSDGAEEEKGRENPLEGRIGLKSPSHLLHTLLL